MERVLLLAVLTSFAVVPLVLAQAPPGEVPSGIPREVPPGAEPDVRLERLEPAEPLLPPRAVEIPEPAAPCRIPPGADRERFVLTRLDVEDATAYPEKFFQSFYGSLLGTEVSLAQLYGIACEIQRVYRDDGYFLARVIVPPQTIRNGEFRLQILEGFVGEVRFEGDIGPARALIEAYLKEVTEERPLRFSTLERGLLLANDVPGVTAIGVLRPSRDQVGAAELVVTLERKLVDGLALIDNYNDEFTGEWETAFGLSTNSFTPLGERITILGLASDPQKGFTDSDRERVVQLATSIRPGLDGLYLNVLGSYGDSHPAFTIEQFNFESTTLFVGAVSGYPIKRSRNANLAVEFGFDFINADTDIFGNEKFSRDKLRVLQLTGVADWLDAALGTLASTSTSISIRQGLPVFDASQSGDEFLSRPDGTGVATVLRGSSSRLQWLLGDLALYGSVAGQFAFNDLLSDEEFKVGSTRFGRGYDWAELFGDHGVGITTELQYNLFPDFEVVDSVQLFGFYDFGQVWDRGSDSDDSLSSAGLGIRGQLLGLLFLEIQGAKPLTQDSQRAGGGRDAQFLFRATARF